MKETISIPKINLEWSEWYTWNSLKNDARGKNGIKIPSDSGVYEVMRRRRQGMLYIGKATQNMVFITKFRQFF